MEAFDGPLNPVARESAILAEEAIQGRRLGRFRGGDRFGRHRRVRKELSNGINGRGQPRGHLGGRVIERLPFSEPPYPPPRPPALHPLIEVGTHEDRNIDQLFASQTEMFEVLPEVEDLRWGSSGSAHTREEFRSEERRVGKECRSRWSPYH